MGDGTTADILNFERPVVEGSGEELPLILGLRSMKEKEPVLETGAGKERLTFPGPGGYTINWSPGTVHIPLEPAASGHLMAPCGEYAKVPAKAAGVATPTTVLHAHPAIANIPTRPTILPADHPRNMLGVAQAFPGAVGDAYSSNQ